VEFPLTWVISIWSDDLDGDRVLFSKKLQRPMGFASRRDANLAIDALVSAGLDNPIALIELGFEKTNQIACSALLW